jgi:hypothetical protein
LSQSQAIRIHLTSNKQKMPLKSYSYNTLLSKIAISQQLYQYFLILVHKSSLPGLLLPCRVHGLAQCLAFLPGVSRAGAVDPNHDAPGLPEG